MRIIVWLACFIPLTCFSAVELQPWGKDSDLANPSSAEKKRAHCPTPLLGQFAESAIQFHQDVISPADGPRSHFFPSSSQYTLEAMRRYGFFEGFLLGCDRLMRENDDPWIYKTITLPNGEEIKYNPVP